MPEWLATSLAVWGAMFPLLVLVIRGHNNLKSKFDRILEHFDVGSEMSQLIGTIPQRLKNVSVELTQLSTDVEGLSERVEKIEIKVDDIEAVVRGHH